VLPTVKIPLRLLNVIPQAASPLILPGSPLFNRTVDTAPLPPGWEREAESLGQLPNYVVDAETGLFRPARNQDELDEYLYGGEYDQRVEQMDAAPEVEHWDLDNGMVSRW